jgi:hypothetical protein
VFKILNVPETFFVVILLVICHFRCHCWVLGFEKFFMILRLLRTYIAKKRTLPTSPLFALLSM